MFAENYPFTRFNMEMRRLYQTGEIGALPTRRASTITDGPAHNPLSPGLKHWRNWLPRRTTAPTLWPR